MFELPLTRRERRLRRWFYALIPFFGVQGAVYIPEVFEGPEVVRPFVINSAAKDALFTGLAIAIALDMRRRVRLGWLIVAGLSLIALLLVLLLATGSGSMAFPPPDWLDDIIGISHSAGGWVWLGTDLLTIPAIALLVLTVEAAAPLPQDGEVPPVPPVPLPAVAGGDAAAPQPNPAPEAAGAAAPPQPDPAPQAAAEAPAEPQPDEGDPEGGGDAMPAAPLARDRSDPGMGFTSPERRLRFLLYVLLVLATVLCAAGILLAIALPGHAPWTQVAFLIGGAARYAIIAVFCLIIASNTRRFELLASLIIVLEIVWLALAIALLAAASSLPTLHLLGTHISLHSVLIISIVVDAVVLLVLLVAGRASRRARFQLSYLPPMAFESLAALAEVVLDRPNMRITPKDVARHVDDYIGTIAAPQKQGISLVLMFFWWLPVFLLRAPMPMLGYTRRRNLVERSFNAAVRRGGPGRHNGPSYYLAHFYIFAQQMIFLGYYCDGRTFASVGYAPASQRQGYPERLNGPRPRIAHPHLRTLRANEIEGETLEADVGIVGSGAGASIVAYHMAMAGRRVLMLEGGKHVDPSEFSEDEVHQLVTLYEEGALQQARDFSFQVLQGKCVGGSTTVNNAVCFDLPQDVLESWNSEHRAALDPTQLAHSFANVRRFMGVQSVQSSHFSAGHEVFADAVGRAGMATDPWKFSVAEANIENCAGSGYCNIGCPNGNKLSALVTVLPAAQRVARHRGGRLEIVPECTVQEIEYDNDRATALVCDLGGRRLRVQADSFFVCGGAIASPWLLIKSGIAPGIAGRRAGFNLASPVTGVFPNRLYSYDGLNITHTIEAPNREFVIESWFNPVVSQALNMPGWLGNHWQNMHSYDRMMAAGVLVGTTTTQARVRRGLSGRLLGIPEIDYEPGRPGDERSEEDMKRLVKGLKAIGRILFEAGAEKVMVNTFEYREFRSEAEMAALNRYVYNAHDLFVGTGHPQGGNPICVDPSEGVVGPDCRVHGFENLYVCDASVFPTAITVNPQLTVMAIANLAASRISQRWLP